ncbi:MAG: glycosyltransferase family 4 protein [Kiritimatiellae bacterium]|jgi:phosphatidylinositol alpha-1,6-mannosyltransferase|nr:glycosyltransferase family 4 protein [Kiritimatiellia bacterium]MDY0148842.1 glycosyltransferase family 4 protein [Kiritimatiellia bacterium]
MNVLMLTWNYPPVVGGIEHVAQHTADGLRALGHTVRVVAPPLPNEALEVAAPSAPVSRARRKGIPCFLLHAVTAGFRLARHSRPDVLLCPSLTSAPAAWLLSRLLRIPYAVLIHGSDILLPRRAYQLAITPLLSGARLLFANSRNTARLLETRGLDPARIRVVCPGVTPPPPPSAHPTADILRVLDETAGRPTLVTVGRLIRRKGNREFIAHTLPLLRKLIPDVLLLVVGGEAKASLIHQERIRQQLTDAIRDGQHDHHALLLGRLSGADLDQIYQRADLFVLPCLDDPHDVEGFGIVILEAALQGVPAIATRCGGIPDAIAEGTTGLLVPPGDPPAMANAIADLLQAPARLLELGENARRRTLADFTWSAIAARYAAGLQELLDVRDP